MIKKYSQLARLEGTPVDLKQIDLNSLYDELNRKYFDNTLPKVPVKIGKGARTYGFVDAKVISSGGQIKSVEIQNLTINDSYKYTAELLNKIMVHEMIHISLFSKKIVKDVGHPSHGLYFKQMIQQMKGKGLEVPLSEDMEGVTETNLKKIPASLTFLTKRKEGDYSIAKVNKKFAEQLNPESDSLFMPPLYKYGWTRGNDIYAGISTDPTNQAPVARTLFNMVSYKITEEEYLKLIETLQNRVVFPATEEGKALLQKREETEKLSNAERVKRMEERLKEKYGKI